MKHSLHRRRATVALLVAAIAVSASSCGYEQRRAERKERAEALGVNPLLVSNFGIVSNRFREVDADGRVPIPTVDSLDIEPTPSGVIALARGTAERQGAFDADLRPRRGDEYVVDGVLTLDFVVDYPAGETAAGNPASRQVLVATSLSQRELEEVTAIRVVAAQNSREQAYEGTFAFDLGPESDGLGDGLGDFGTEIPGEDAATGAGELGGGEPEQDSPPDEAPEENAQETPEENGPEEAGAEQDAPQDETSPENSEESGQ